MGNCPSTRGKFTPNQDCEKHSTNIVLKPVDQDEKIVLDENIPEKTPQEGIDEKNSYPAIDGVDETDPVPTKNGSTTDLESYIEQDEEVPLIVELVNVCIPSNTALHHTNPFHLARKENPRLILRRGSPFQVVLTLNRIFDPDKDILCLVFSLKDANSPSFAQNTYILLPFVSCGSSFPHNSSWKMKVLEVEEKTLKLEVISSSSAIIGEWILEVDSRVKDDVNAPDFRYKFQDPLIILFNPWCDSDVVYLEEEDKREEYVMSDSGLIWRGTHTSPRPCIWNYAQFEEDILACCLYILSKVGHLNIVSRADPISISRHVSAVLNSHDDHGVLVGGGSSKYGNGKSATMWSGSQIILQKYLKKKKPVKYGQCWVFAGLFTTVCRALGIPCRPVTNFSSAHDTHNSLAVDRFFDPHGKPLDKMNIDSIWNFHVWNEVWMLRPDLEPGGYGGWQAVDATSQEESDGLYRCGPASVVAIKRQEVKKAFDTDFLFAEVNASKIYWKYNGQNQPLKLLKKTTHEIGCDISTKAVGKFERDNITQNYKQTERADEDKETALKAMNESKNAFSRYYLNEEQDFIMFELTLSENILIGSPIEIHLKAKNTKEEGQQYIIQVSLNVHSALYTGDIKKLVKKDEFEIQLGPGVENDMIMHLAYEEYERALVDQCAFIVSVMAHVNETGFDYCTEDIFRLEMPVIGIQVDEEVVENQPVSVTATLTNPLPKPLKGGVFVLEGPGFEKAVMLKMKGAILPGSEASVKCEMTPTLAGAKVIIVKFRSKELQDVEGYHPLHVKPSPASAKDNNSHL